MIFGIDASEAFGTHELVDGKEFEIMVKGWTIIQDYSCGDRWQEDCVFQMGSGIATITVMKNPSWFWCSLYVEDDTCEASGDVLGQFTQIGLIEELKQDCDNAEFSRQGYECWGFHYDKNKFRTGTINGLSAYSVDYSEWWKPIMNKNQPGYPGHVGETNRLTVISDGANTWLIWASICRKYPGGS